MGNPAVQPGTQREYKQLHREKSDVFPGDFANSHDGVNGILHHYNAKEDKKMANVQAWQKAFGIGTLSWFTGVVGLFAADQLGPLSRDISNWANSSLSLDTISLDIDRVLMGGAGILLWANFGLQFRRRYLELIQENDEKKSTEQRTKNEILWQAFADSWKNFVPAFLASVAVVLNTIKMVASTAMSGMYAIFSAVAGSLFAAIEAFHAVLFFKNGLASKNHFKVLSKLKANLGNQNKLNFDNFILQHRGEEQQAALKAAHAKMKTLGKHGIDVDNLNLTETQWLDMAKEVHRREKNSNFIKGTLHAVLGLGMFAAFASGHIFTFGAMIIGKALWATFGGLALRLTAALWPEQKNLAKKLKEISGTDNQVYVLNPVRKDASVLSIGEDQSPSTVPGPSTAQDSRVGNGSGSGNSRPTERDSLLFRGRSSPSQPTVPGPSTDQDFSGDASDLV